MSYSLLWVELSPSCSRPPRFVEVLTSSPANVAFFGNGACADVIELRGGHTGLGRALNSVTGDLIRRDLKPQRRHETEGHVKIEAENGIMLPQAKECQGLLASTRSEQNH